MAASSFWLVGFESVPQTIGIRRSFDRLLSPGPPYFGVAPPITVASLLPGLPFLIHGVDYSTVRPEDKGTSNPFAIVRLLILEPKSASHIRVLHQASGEPDLMSKSGLTLDSTFPVIERSNSLHLI